MKNVESKIVYYGETFDCSPLMF